MLSMYCYFFEWADDDMNLHAKQLSLTSRGQEPVAVIQDYEHCRGKIKSPDAFLSESTFYSERNHWHGVVGVKNAHAAAFT
jgi:major membrane immunogen (membrane-anchored lipoprotein)